MIITKITPFLVDRFLLVRVYTDAGIVGNGEADLWAHHPTVAQHINDLSHYYVGKDAGRIEHHYQAVTRHTHFMGAALSAAVSAIDIALWDILAKSVDLPVYQLLGGKCRDRVKVFANVVGDTPEAFGESAAGSVATGYTSLRTMPFLPGWDQIPASKMIGQAVDIVAAIREAIGYDVDLGLELHRNLRTEEAITLAHELAPFRILYYEDPLAPESNEALAYVAKHVDIPIATGERFYNLFQFKELIDSGTVSSDPAGLVAGGRLYTGQEDRRHGRGSLHRHVPAPDGQPGQHRGVYPARRSDPQLLPARGLRGGRRVQRHRRPSAAARRRLAHCAGQAGHRAGDRRKQAGEVSVPPAHDRSQSRCGWRRTPLTHARFITKTRRP